MIYLEKFSDNEDYDGTAVTVTYDVEAGYDGGRDEPSYDDSIEITSVVDAETGESYHNDISDEDIDMLNSKAQKIESEDHGDYDDYDDEPDVHRYYSPESVQVKNSSFIAELNRVRKLAGLLSESHGGKEGRFNTTIEDPRLGRGDNEVEVVVEYCYTPSSSSETGADIEIMSVTDIGSGEDLHELISDELIDDFIDSAHDHAGIGVQDEYDMKGDNARDLAQDDYLTDEYEIDRIRHLSGLEEESGSDNEEIAAELEQIAEQIMELAEHAYSMLPEGDIKARARAYWYGHLMAAVGSDMYASKYDTTMISTIDELQNDESENEW